MSTHKKQQPAGEQFARPVWDAVRDLEIEHKVYLHVDITMTGRRGVMEVRVLAYDETVAKERRPICSCARDWPNSQDVSLPGLIFALVNSMAVSIRDHRMDELMRQQQSDLWGKRGGNVRLS